MKYLDLAAALAAKVDWRDVYPNPRVGCVIVRDGEVVATGVHEKCGGAHAEVNALASLRVNPGLDCGDADFKPGFGCEIYITLEPCDHFSGKKTGSCTQKLLELKPSKVVVGALDERFGGRNVEKLREAGIEVEVVDHEESQNLARVRPKVILKMAQTLDGKISKGGKKDIITSLESRKKVHQLRSEVDAILTTTETVLRDDPILDCRLIGGRKTPDLIVFGKSEISEGAKIFQYSERKVMRFNGDDLARDLREVSEKGIKTVMTECGAKMAKTLLRERLVDKIWLFIAPKIWGQGVDVFSGEVDLSGFEMLGAENVRGDVLVRYGRKGIENF